MPRTAIRLRLFLTCWLVYALHFATDFVREHYLVVSIVEDHTYALDKYLGLHVDIALNPPEAKVRGAHQNANPGVSMLAAIPYAIFRPAVDYVVRRELAAREARGDTSAVYRDPRAKRVEFYQKIRHMGLDVRFALVSAITQVFCMAPVSAASVVLMFQLLAALGLGQRPALGLSLLYGFGTPVFLRTGFLNQNLVLGLAAFAGFALLWNPDGFSRWSMRRRHLVAGLLGGFAFLCDYSGAILMALLGLYAWWRRGDEVPVRQGFRDSLWYALGCLPGILLLWQYQYASFGNPFLPPQNWMAPIDLTNVGYKGVGGLSLELLRMLLFDARFGLLVTMPIAVLAVAGPWLARRGRGPVRQRETLVCICLTTALVLFFGTVQYTRLQWVTGIRYLACIIPFAYLAAVPALLRLPRVLTYALAIGSVTLNWSLAMVRSQGTVIDNLERVFVGGFQLPWLTVLSKLSTQYAPWLQGGVSPLPLLALTGIVIALVWTVEQPGAPLAGEG
jgi:hypothetical protein